MPSKFGSILLLLLLFADNVNRSIAKMSDGRAYFPEAVPLAPHALHRVVSAYDVRGSGVPRARRSSTYLFVA